MDVLRQFYQDLFARMDFLPAEIAKFFGQLLMALTWIVIGIILAIIFRLIVRRLRKKQKTTPTNRQRTVLALIFSICKLIIWFVVILLVIQEFGVQIGPLLAASGILMFAIGFGAQEAIKDFIAGFFLIFEHAFDIGDLVEIGGFRGRVIEIGLRRTKLKNFKNEVRIINNGDIRVITNISLDISVGVVEIVVPKSFAFDAFQTEDFKELLGRFEDYENFLSVPVIAGVVADDASTYTLRITFNAVSTTHPPLERLVREKVLEYIRDSRVTQLNAIK